MDSSVAIQRDAKKALFHCRLSGGGYGEAGILKAMQPSSEPSTTLASQFRGRIAAANGKLAAVTEAHSQTLYPGGAWTRRQVLGHLLDSAANNHQRFVRALLDGPYVGPGYDADAWVAVHGYADWPWAELLRHWQDRNEQLCRVVERLTPEALGLSCRVGDGEPVTLEFLVTDYLDHLEGHLAQILA